MDSTTQRQPSGSAMGLMAPLVLLLVSLGAGAWWAAEALVVRQTVQESRTVADLAENVGKWASQYGGVHARTVGVDAKFPGNFLTRATFGASDTATPAAPASEGSEKQALSRVETFYWKNPALIQREVADVITASGSASRYRLTARTVMNKNNAPNAFEVEALDALLASPGRAEYWVVKGGQMLYARAVVAQKSCLRCHTSAETTPDFIRTNAMFNGGGGYGYVEGQPAGLISVTVPLVSPAQALVGSVPPKLWAATGLAVLALVWLLLALRRPGVRR